MGNMLTVKFIVSEDDFAEVMGGIRELKRRGQLKGTNELTLTRKSAANVPEVTEVIKLDDDPVTLKSG